MKQQSSHTEKKSTARFRYTLCGVSIFILSYAAKAGDGFQISVGNQFPDFCKIVGKPISSVDAAATIVSSATGSTKIDFGTSFANADATGRQISGKVQFAVFTNAQCDYVLTSAYGALRNVTAGQSGAFRDYYADAYSTSGSGEPVHLDSLSSNTFVNRFSIPTPIGWGVNTVVIEFDIPETSTPLAAGEYQDILSLTINPSM